MPTLPKFSRTITRNTLIFFLFHLISKALWLLKLDIKVQDKFGSAPRFLCLFNLIVFYQQRHAGRYVVTRDVLAPWRHDVTRRKAYPTYSGPRKVYNICCTKFSLNNFYKLDNNYFKISKHKISRLQSVNL